MLDETLVQPARVLGALVRIDDLHEIECAVLLCSRDRRLAGGNRVRADEGERSRLDLELPGADELRDDARQDLGLERTAARALQVDVFDHRRRRLRRAENEPVLRDPGKLALDDIGVGQGVGERAASRHRPRRGRAPTADGERDSDSGARDHGRNDGRNDEHLRRSTAALALARDRGRRSRLLAALPCLFTAHES